MVKLKMYMKKYYEILCDYIIKNACCTDIGQIATEQSNH